MDFLVGFAQEWSRRTPQGFPLCHKEVSHLDVISVQGLTFSIFHVRLRRGASPKSLEWLALLPGRAMDVNAAHAIDRSSPEQGSL